MATSSNHCPADQSTASRASEEFTAARLAEKAGVSMNVARTFTRISAPENKATFSAKAAATAFLHIKVDPSP